MTYDGKVSILVTGCDGLEKTAQFVQEHYRNAGQEIPILAWRRGITLPDEKPYILILKESDLSHEDVLKIHADDRVSVALAGQEKIRKGSIYYFSKNRAL